MTDTLPSGASPSGTADQPSTVPSLGPTTTPTTTASLDAASLAALQQVLAGEHAVIWAYGALGPHVDPTAEDRVRALLVAHQTTREAVRADIVGGGGRPVAAEPAYALPIVPRDATTAAQLAALVEERLAAVYADVVAAGPEPALRTRGVDGVIVSALRAASWGPTETTFPGLPEREDT